MSTPNLLLQLNQLLANSKATDTEIQVHCLIRISSSHHAVDHVVGVYFNKKEADKACEELKASVQKRSRHKIYVQTSVLGK